MVKVVGSFFFLGGGPRQGNLVLWLHMNVRGVVYVPGSTVNKNRVCRTVIIEYQSAAFYLTRETDWSVPETCLPGFRWWGKNRLPWMLQIFRLFHDGFDAVEHLSANITLQISRTNHSTVSIHALVPYDARKRYPPSGFVGCVRVCAFRKVAQLSQATFLVHLWSTRCCTPPSASPN